MGAVAEKILTVYLVTWKIKFVKLDVETFHIHVRSALESHLD